MIVLMKKFSSQIVAVCVFLLTLLIAPYYVEGDQHWYIIAYNELSDLGLVEGYESYQNMVGSKEYIHYLLIRLASGLGVEKDVFVGISNAFLAYFAMKLFEKWKVSVFVAMSIVLTNFYMVVMYFAAERLKFGFIFLVLSMMYVGSNKRFYALAFLAVSAHVQVLVMYASILFNHLFRAVARFARTLRISVKGIVLPLLLLVPLVFLAEYMYLKAVYYFALANAKDASDLIRIVLLLILSLWYSKNKKETFLLFIPMILAVFIVGADRINMMGYFVFLYYGLQYRGGRNLGVLATSAYFAFKSYYFVSDIIEYGNGFENVLNQLNNITRSIYA